MKQVIVCRSLDELPQAAAQVIDLCQSHAIWLFEGDMGAGKTTLIKAICQQMGVLTTVQSPTFSIVNEYLTYEGQTIYHFDCYRLKNEIEALDFGIEEYLDSGNYCFIEWPSKIEHLIPKEAIAITIHAESSGQRVIEVERQEVKG
ncbi:MAG: tRNA (adenosine(37)-N6)-threonylcarbamoyltransferase complex ATPase subunit type 1 TsaE [Spirosomataceae bacterium]